MFCRPFTVVCYMMIIVMGSNVGGFCAQEGGRGAGGKFRLLREQWQERLANMTPEQREAAQIRQRERQAVREEMKTMSPEERKEFRQKLREERARKRKQNQTEVS